MSSSTDPVRRLMVAANPAPRDAEAPGEVLSASGLLELIDERSGGMTNTTINQYREHKPIRTREQWIWAFAGGLTMVLLAVGIAALLMGGGGNDVVQTPASTVSTTPAAPTTSATAQTHTSTSLLPSTSPQASPTEVPLLAGSTWLSVADQSVFGDATNMVGVVAAGPGFVAVGERLTADGAIVAHEVWVSTDGYEWRTEATLASIPTGPPPRLTAGPMGIVLWSETSVSSSTDGLTWQNAVLPEGRYLGALAADDSGFLAAAHAGSDVVLLRSSDGVRWSEVRPGLPETVAGVDGIAEWSGGWIAWGWDCADGDPCDRMWVSSDGNVWRTLEGRPDHLAGAYLEDVIGFREGLIAVGTVSESPAVWTSADGASWETMYSVSPGEAWGVLASEDAVYLRVSHDERAFDRPDEVWMSLDAREFTRIGVEAVFGTPALRQLAVSDDTLVAVGSHNWDVWPPQPVVYVWQGAPGG